MSATPDAKLEDKKAAKAKKIEEKRKAVEERKKQSFRENFKREIDLTKKSRVILDEHWEKVCGNITKEEILKTMEVKRQSLMKSLDEKDKAMEKLLEATDEANTQYERRLNAHIQILEYLIGIHKYFVDLFKEIYASNSLFMIREFNEEKENYKKKLKEERDYDEQFRHTENAAMKKDYNDRQEELIKKKIFFHVCTLERREAIKERLVEITRKVKKQMREVLKVWRQKSNTPRTISHNRMFESFRYNVIRIKKLEEEVQKRQRFAMKLKNEFYELEYLFNTKTRVLKNEKIRLEYIYWDHKKFHKNYLDQDHQRLLVLVNVAASATKALDERLKLMNSLMTLSNMCLKKEKPEEKLVRENKQIEILLEENITKDELGPLGWMVQKIVNVEFKRDFLFAEKYHLKKENDELRQKLQEYCIQQKVQANMNHLMDNYPKLVAKPGPHQEASVIPQIKSQIRKN